nr:hypothetical protein [Tanacetum cinerariifolium]
MYHMMIRRKNFHGTLSTMKILETETGKGGDEVRESKGERDEEETRLEEEKSFDPIPKTPEESEEESNDEEDQDLRLSEEARIQEEEDADELYRDVNINQGRGLQVTQNIEDTHVTLTPVKEQVSRILPRIKESVNATLEAEVLTRSSHSSRTSYAIAADLSEMELKKILIEKMEGNKSIQRLDEQRNLYKALVEAYDADKAILDTYGDSTILKRRREDDDQEGPSAGSDRGSKRQKEGGEHASASTPSEKATRSEGRTTTGSQSRQLSASKSAYAEEPMQTTCQMEEPPHPPRKPPSPDRDWNKTLPAAQGDAQSWISDLARQTDARSSFNKLLDTPLDFSNFIMNRLNIMGTSNELKIWCPCDVDTATDRLQQVRPLESFSLGVETSAVLWDVHQEHCHQEASGRPSTGKEELVKSDEEDTESGKGGDEVRESEGESEEKEETRQEEEESFDPIPKTPEESEEDQDLRLSEEARIQEEEEADELYRDVNINQRRGLQVTQNVKDSHVTLTPVNPDGPQESSSMSTFVISMLNPTSDVGVESIFTTASSLIVSIQT